MKSKKTHVVVLILRYVILACIVSGVVVGLRYFLDTRKKTTYEAPHPAVVIQRPVRTTIERSVVLSGHVEADAMIPVVPLVSGTIMEYPVKAGDYVTEGDIVAVIDKRPYEQQMLQAEAAYLASQSTFERVDGLYAANAVSRQNYDEAKAQRDAMLAQYDLAKIQLGYAEVTAPVSGTVLMAPSAKGSIGTSQQPVAVIADLENLVVRLDVPEKYFDLFSTNRRKLKAQVIRPASGNLSPEARSEVTIETIAPYIQPQSKVFEVVCRLQENLDDFRPGMYVKVGIVYETQDNVPALAQTVRKVDGSCYGYDEQSGTAKWIELTPTIENDQLFAVPKDYADLWFIVEGQHQVFDGQDVTVHKRLDAAGREIASSGTSSKASSTDSLSVVGAKEGASL